jgi:O-antigen ligase
MKGLILTYLVVVAGSVASLFNPLVGLCVYTLFSIVRPQLFFGWAGNLENISLIVGVAMLVGWGLNGFGRWQFGRAKSIVYALLGFYVWVILSSVFAANQSLAWQTVLERTKIVLPFLVGITLFEDEAWVRRYACLVVLSSGYVAFEMNQVYLLEGYNRAHFEGLFGDNNSFAIAMVAVVGPSLFLGFSTTSWWKKLLAFGCAALSMHTVLLTFSRGGMVALIVTAVTVVVLMPKKPGYLAAIVLAALIGFRLTGPELTARFMTTFAEEDSRDFSATSRLELWRDCLTVMARYPVFGIGPRHWPLVAEEFGWPAGKEAHSLWMQTGAELGPTGLVLLVSFYTLAAAKGLRLARTASSPASAAHGLYVFSGLVGFVVSAQFVSLEGLEVPYFVALVGAGTLKVSGAPTEAADARLATADVVPKHPVSGRPRTPASGEAR